MKPITVWLTPAGPNAWKVITIMIELGVPYELKSFKHDDVKKPPFTDLNPNGRVPAIVDPNTDLTLWESGAIVQYLIEVYDTEKKLTYEGLRERHLLNQYLHFQMSGQGPYFGQAGWFNYLHGEKIPSAIERYENEMLRVIGVLDGVLKGRDWLVGDKCTFADLAFLPWNDRINMLVLSKSIDEIRAQYPNFAAWQARMVARDSWKEAMETRTQLMDEQGLMPNGMPKGITSMAQYEEYMAKTAEEKRG
ncbi:hypothetical protein BHE90_001223 [Fusarium euwallaceae]|uniref:glutathione transferase n=2 Tax=Fusarium solani species complex TaxID=232080 RepID=A0A3M2S573_9HYPO|nr:hypothetical protein CDV36_007621 [Fusarium kuroshium]RTE84193.1 hypothetical protein BHE90_001223 [Fusarium euwallaceae]